MNGRCKYSLHIHTHTHAHTHVGSPQLTTSWSVPGFAQVSIWFRNRRQRLRLNGSTGYVQAQITRAEDISPHEDDEESLSEVGEDDFAEVGADDSVLRKVDLTDVRSGMFDALLPDIDLPEPGVSLDGGVGLDTPSNYSSELESVALALENGISSLAPGGAPSPPPVPPPPPPSQRAAPTLRQLAPAPAPAPMPSAPRHAPAIPASGAMAGVPMAELFRMTNAMPLGTNDTLTRGLLLDAIRPPAAAPPRPTMPSLARPGCAVPFQPLGHAPMSGYSMSNSFGHAAMHATAPVVAPVTAPVAAPVAPPISDLIAPAHDDPFRLQMPRSSRPKLMPDKHVYRGGILSSDDAERAYVHTFNSVSPEYA